jgi:hypothetical protein
MTRMQYAYLVVSVTHAGTSDGDNVGATVGV